MRLLFGPEKLDQAHLITNLAHHLDERLNPRGNLMDYGKQQEEISQVITEVLEVLQVFQLEPGQAPPPQ